jgi:hypothetical protein
MITSQRASRSDNFPPERSYLLFIVHILHGARLSPTNDRQRGTCRCIIHVQPDGAEPRCSCLES